MMQRGAPGTIVNIISIDSHGGQSFLAPYVAAKAGLAGLTRNAAHAHRWDRIRINGLNIGWTGTEGEDADPAPVPRRRRRTGSEQAAAALPMGKLGQVDEIADFVVFLLSDRSGVVTGSVIDWDQNVLGGLGTDRPLVRTLATKETVMRIGLIGLGRIGAFHADTLSAPRRRSTRSSSPTRCPRSPRAVAETVRRRGRRRRRRRCSAAGVDGDRDRRRHRRAPGADPRRRRGRHPGVLREAARPERRRSRRHRRLRQRQRGAGADRLPPPLRPGLRSPPATPCVSGELGWLHTVRSTTLDPAPAAARRTSPSPAGSSATARVHDFDTVRWVTGREVVEVYATGSARGDDFFAELGDVATAQTLLTFDDGATAVVSNTRYNAARVRRPAGAARHRRQRRRRLDRQLAAAQPRSRRRAGRPASPGRSSWTGSPTRSAPSSPRSPRSSPGTRPSPCTVDDALAVTWIAEAATLSLQQHRPVQIAEVQQ